jgi:hypothetical protein
MVEEGDDERSDQELSCPPPESGPDPADVAEGGSVGPSQRGEDRGAA